MKKTTIVGSGLSGLSASCYLAKEGFDVTLVEKNNDVGGRLSSISVDGFRFDLGPSWYWMPDVFDKFFSDFGKNRNDYYTLERLDPSYKFFMSESSYEMPANLDELYNVFESIEEGSSLNLKKYIKQAKLKYDISMDQFIYFPNKSALEYLRISLVKHVFSLDMFKSLRKHISSLFENKKIRYMLEFPSMFLGGTPSNTPALYSLMNYADIIGGTWYPNGGMSSISNGFYLLSKELGVKHVFNDEIKKININSSNEINSIVSDNGNIYISDNYLFCAEYPFVQMELLNDKHRSYDTNYWSKRDVAPSALIFYLGLSEKVKNINHHNLFFDRSFDNHLNDIFDKKQWPKDPLFYICCPSKTDSSVVPNANMENIFILIPIAPGSIDTSEIREKYFNNIINRIEEVSNQKIQDKIVVKKSFCVNDFKDRYNSYKGNAYGLANTLLQTAFLKPKIKDKKIKNLYYSGHFTTPGPGLPPAVISGKIASKQIIKDFQ